MTQKSPWNLKKLTIQTPVKDHQLILEWKTCMEYYYYFYHYQYYCNNNKALDPRDDIDRLYVSRKERGRGLTNTEDSVNESIQWLKDYIKKVQWKTDYSDQK